MELHGKNIIGGKAVASSNAKTFNSIAAASGEKLNPVFHKATPEQADEAVALATKAFEEYRKLPAEKIAEFLNRIAEEILKLGDALIQRASAETGLPEARLQGERARTVNQFKMFAELVREISWLEATIDRAQPDRKPLPKVDLRRMLVPLGPVVVFGASNFPLAFSVGGGDTASALAAGCPVIVKAHSAHPGAGEMVGHAIQAAIEALGLPAGVFAMVHGDGTEIGMRLVTNPGTKAVGFTGSTAGGRALFDAACKRPEPIPVFAEMGSVNPVFILPHALKQNGKTIAEGLAQSVTLGVGQFCTNPGLLFVPEGDELRKALVTAVEGTGGGPMLAERIRDGYLGGVERLGELELLAEGKPGEGAWAVTPKVFTTDLETFAGKLPHIGEECFGPASIVVTYREISDLRPVLERLDGSLTATIHSADPDEAGNLVDVLGRKAGRLIWNGWPTGVAVCWAMQHGGPWPAATTTSTSVGATAIERWLAPTAYQDWPEALLPDELKEDNPLSVPRRVDGRYVQVK